jgi:raffinose/stachyose/melibiose transport system substrate-binding protein
VSQNEYAKGYLASLNDLPGMQNYTAAVKSAWSTDDGKTTFCVPMASVLHGFFYNKDVFARLNLKVPTTNAEFMADLQAIKADGKVAPLALGVKDQFPVALNAYYNIGPNFWKGEQGRIGLIMTTQKFTDPQFVQPMQQLTTWVPYLESGYQATGYSDAQTLFELGKAAINPAGSWDLPPFEAALKSSLGWFSPPVQQAGDQCYQEDMIDHALGMNAQTAHPAEARMFLQWVASTDFETLYGNAIPGFFPVINASITLKDPLAQQILDTRKTCQGSLRLSYQFLSRGQPNLENDLWTESTAVINQTTSATAAMQLIQQHLDSWYKAPAGFNPASIAP